MFALSALVLAAQMIMPSSAPAPAPAPVVVSSFAVTTSGAGGSLA